MGIEEEPAVGIPEWVVTFGDMMSLLLTFFIMLVSLSEIKEEEKYQAIVESMRKQFGYDLSATAVPGEHTPMSSPLQFPSSSGRAQRKNTANGGDEVQAITGENPQVQTIRPSKMATVGGVIYFDEDSPELSLENKSDLDTIIRQVVGKPQKIEVRGHTSRKPAQQRDGVRDHWDLAYQRCYNTMLYFVEHGIEPARIRLGSAAAYEPLNNAIEPGLRKRNARIEVLLWDERVDDLSGSK